jgi:hypothetical protein
MRGWKRLVLGFVLGRKDIAVLELFQEVILDEVTLFAFRAI